MDERERRRAPAPAALAQLAETLAPGSRVAGVRRLTGGLDAAMHTVDLLTPDGERQRLVVRRYLAHWHERVREMALRSWRTLEALATLGVSAPRPVLPDLDGALFGAPAFVMTRVPGRGFITPRDPDPWIAQLASALASLHRAPVQTADLSFLLGPEAAVDEQMRWAMHHTRDELNPDSAAVRATLLRLRPHLHRTEPVLTHGDYWGGNTLWLRGRLTAIVDWDGAAVGYPGMDVGYAREDLATLLSMEAADRFLELYETAAGWQIPHLYFWDLLGAARALPDPERWLPGYYDLGRTEITPEMSRQRVHTFIANALTQAG